ncbi:Steroid 5-alpha-reductase DET2 [Acorus calamus]|uniref:Steroid 5-alpha-reductase DET2 n=1 Tax=Acorus calamus TaxID=4465 RepID=A0AAV9F607_ACOCL|nr:Steroid 5-alpha-reductase DET2 [Acorus calamus]
MDDFYRFTLLTLYLLSPLTVLRLQTLTAPYGCHFRRGWGPSIPPSLAWFLMESPTIWFSALLLPLGRHRLHPKSLLLSSAFLLHYTHCTLIYPLRLRRNHRRPLRCRPRLLLQPPQHLRPDPVGLPLRRLRSPPVVVDPGRIGGVCGGNGRECVVGCGFGGVEGGGGEVQGAEGGVVRVGLLP